MLLNGNVGRVSDKPDLPINEVFRASLSIGIEDMYKDTKRKPSKYYTPSGMNCIRQMYYKRRQVPMDKDDTDYTGIGGADTGTRRHEAIQEALIWMTNHKSRFLYVDVDTYIQKKQERGKCLNIVVQDHVGAEVSLWDKDRDVKFRCDGIIYDKVTKDFFLFEFKNQISFKASGKQSVDKAHHAQVTMYCAELDLNKALVTYENRDTLQLYVPEVFEVTEYDKQLMLNKIDACEEYCKRGEVPKRPDNLSPSDCRYCNYKKTCKMDG